MGYKTTKICQDLSRRVLFETCGVSGRRPDKCGCIRNSCGPGSSVGVTTDYGLDGPGSNSGGDKIFRPSRPVLWPTQPPVKWVPGFSRG